MIQTILFATDMGIHTHYLLHHVNALATMHGARVIVVHAIEPPGVLGRAVVHSCLGTDGEEAITDDGIDGIAREVKGRIVDLLEDEYIDGQQGLSRIRDVQVIPGKPVDVIFQQVSDHNVDLLIVGSHGSDTESPNLLGSVTSRILQLSRVPVYMVPLVRNLPAQARAG